MERQPAMDALCRAGRLKIWRARRDEAVIVRKRKRKKKKPGQFDSRKRFREWNGGNKPSSQGRMMLNAPFDWPGAFLRSP
ncbi:hypothetical protein VUR80DRAFT_2919 [Thermomyces stellatus]